MKNLFVGNMSFQTTEGDLRTIFEPFGEITRINVMTDRDTGRARGFAFVEMVNDTEAAGAIAALNGKEVDGRALNVNEARPKTERSGPRNFCRGGGGGPAPYKKPSRDDGSEFAHPLRGPRCYIYVVQPGGIAFPPLTIHPPWSFP